MLKKEKKKKSTYHAPDFKMEKFIVILEITSYKVWDCTEVFSPTKKEVLFVFLEFKEVCETVCKTVEWIYKIAYFMAVSHSLFRWKLFSTPFYEENKL